MKMKIYVVMMNADFTEGRGPMLFHMAFLHGEHAVEYVASQKGIFDSPQKVEMGKHGYYAYANGYVIKEVELIEDSIIDRQKLREEMRQQALNKLSPEEREILGLGDK